MPNKFIIDDRIYIFLSVVINLNSVKRAYRQTEIAKSPQKGTTTSTRDHRFVSSSMDRL